MKRFFKSIPPHIFSISFLTVLAFIYCMPALTAPFWGDHDTWSNLLPIVHFRISILENYSLPLFTDFWYGGRAQWQNPLWSFLYLPATFVWLTVPLDWGARIIFFGHLIFSLLAGRKLAALFVQGEISRAATAILFTAPMLPALLPGHVEKVMAWGWILLAIYFLLDEKYSLARRGAYSGLCLGIMALTGANYHVFYSVILLLPLVLSFRHLRLLFSFLIGAFIGLLHLPSVWHLIGVVRANPAESILMYSTNAIGPISSLAMGIAPPIGWESWAVIGLPAVYLFVRSLVVDVKKTPAHVYQKVALLVSIIVLGLLATGVLYKGHHLLDTFRVPVRAVSLLAVAVTMYILLGASKSTMQNAKFTQTVLAISALQVCILASIQVRPTGSQHSPYDKDVQQIASVLMQDHAESVWLPATELEDMYLHLALTEHGLVLPNVYYGDMGQHISIKGEHCGYSFDHLLTPAIHDEENIDLINAISNQHIGVVSLSELQFVQQISFDGQAYELYRVVCEK